MRFACLLLCLLGSLGSARAGDIGPKLPGEDPPQTLAPNRFSLVIGIDTYADKDVPALRFCEGDAKAIHDLLTNPDIGGVAPANATLLIGKDATTRNIKSALNKLRLIPKDSTVFLYYSGHGAKDGADGFIVTHDAAMADLAASAISDSELKSFLVKIPSDRVVLLLDCCYAAALARDKKAVFDSEELLTKFTGKGLAVLSAAGAREEAIEAADLKRSVFTHFVIEALSGKADTNRDGYIVLTELTEYVDSKVAEEARKRGGLQRPVVDLKQLQEPSKFLVCADARRLAEIARESHASQAQTMARVAKLKDLFTADKITADQFKEARTLLESPDPELGDAQKGRRGVYIDLAEGKLDAKYLAGALAAIPSGPARPSETSPAETKPAADKSPAPRQPVDGAGLTGAAALEQLVGAWNITQTYADFGKPDGLGKVERGAEVWRWESRGSSASYDTTVEGPAGAEARGSGTLSIEADGKVNWTFKPRAGEWLRLTGAWDAAQRGTDLRGRQKLPDGSQVDTHIVFRAPDAQTYTMKILMVLPDGHEVAILDVTARKAGGEAPPSPPKNPQTPLSPEGRIMERMLGAWDITQTEYNADGSPAEHYKGVETYTWQTRGAVLHMQSLLRDTDNDEHNQLGTLRFNPASRKWELAASADGENVAFEGTFDVGTNAFVLRTQRTAPDGTVFRERIVIRLVGQDTIETTGTLTLPDGREFKSFEAHGKRK